jgi:hypothetical protein
MRFWMQLRNLPIEALAWFVGAKAFFAFRDYQRAHNAFKAGYSSLSPAQLQALTEADPDIKRLKAASNRAQFLTVCIYLAIPLLLLAIRRLQA